MSQRGRPEQSETREIRIDFPPGLKEGVYSNVMRVTHTQEEFIMDFMLVAPPHGVATARVIMSPGHIKRTISALQDNLKKYEAKFGTLREAPEPPKASLGFHQD